MDGNNTKVAASSGTMTLTDNETGKSIELPVLNGSVGPKVIDVLVPVDSCTDAVEMTAIAITPPPDALNSAAGHCSSRTPIAPCR